MAIQHHPLSNAALGEFIQHQHMGKYTVFVYEHGNVKLTCPDSAQWKWQMHLNAESLTEGTYYRNSSEPIGIEYDAYDSKGNIVDFKTEQGVSPALDKASVDGMDDMTLWMHKSLNVVGE